MNYRREKISDPRNTHEEKFQTHEIAMRQKLNPRRHNSTRPTRPTMAQDPRNLVHSFANNGKKSSVFLTVASTLIDSVLDMHILCFYLFHRLYSQKPKTICFFIFEVRAMIFFLASRLSSTEKNLLFIMMSVLFCFKPKQHFN